MSLRSHSRRQWLKHSAHAVSVLTPIFLPGMAASQAPVPMPLSRTNTQAFRAWFCAIVDEIAQREPSPRWVHRDCAGLVRFAAHEAFAVHDARWRKAVGWPQGVRTPPDVDLAVVQARQYTQWALPDGGRAAYASAQALIQENTRPLGQSATSILAGDLLFFDQGADQHLMVWTGRQIVYHTGAEPTAQDTGLRRTSLQALRAHADTRWRASPRNPNFAGWYRFGFLSS